MAMRGLVVFISDIRNCQSKEQEQKRIDKEMANIRQKFSKPGDLNGYQRKKYVWKILYMFMLGYEIDFGHMESVGLISSPKYSEKMVGYMACSLLLREGDELLRLIINSIKNDLTSQQDNFMCLAMGSICTVGGREFAETLASDVQKILLDKMTKVFVRKKAALTLLRLYRKNQECINPTEIADRVLALLDDSNLGVLTAIISMVLGFVAYSPEGWERAPQRAIMLLTRIVINKEYSNDYLYYGIPSPWLQIRLLRLITFFPPLDPAHDRVLIDRLVTVLQRVITGTDVTKNVNKNNATHGVLFEAINVVIHQGRATDLLPQAVALLGRFISIREANIRYLGLETMAKLSQHPDCAHDIKKHQSTILFSLKDADVSIRRRALDLVYSMCDDSNCRETIRELLSYLANADYNLREELVLKIAILAERFADDYAWYVDVVLQLIKTAGEQVSEEIWYRVVQIITNEEALQKYATQTVFRALLQDAHPPDKLVRICAYVLGEFGHLVAEERGMSSREQFRALHGHYAGTDLQTRALLLSTFVKLAHVYPELEGEVSRALRSSLSALDQEVQQRALEYSVLTSGRFSELKAAVLEMMPAFPERESAVLKRIRVRVADETGQGRGDVVAERLARQPSGNRAAGGGGGAAAAADADGGRGLAANGGGGGSADLLGGEIDGGGGGGGGVDAMLGGLDLGSGGGGGAPPPPSGGGAGAPDLLGLDLGGGGGGGAPPPPPPAAGGIDVAGLMSGGGGGGGGGGGSGGSGPVEPPSFIPLSVRSDGVLYEDGSVQVGLKSEYKGAQGRLVLYYGNKTAQPLVSFTASVVSVPEVTVQASTVPHTVQPRQQLQQMITLECLAPFGAPPSLRLSFMGAPAAGLHLKLPVSPTKFCAPMPGLEAAPFFERWNGAGGPPNEAQQITTLKERPQNMALFSELSAKGLHLANLAGVDPAPTNLVAIGCIVLKGKAQPECPLLMLRIEINLQTVQARVTVRSPHGPMSALVLRQVVETIGK